VKSPEIHALSIRSMASTNACHSQLGHLVLDVELRLAKFLEHGVHIGRLQPKGLVGFVDQGEVLIEDALECPLVSCDIQLEALSLRVHLESFRLPEVEGILEDVVQCLARLRRT